MKKKDRNKHAKQTKSKTPKGDRLPGQDEAEQVSKALAEAEKQKYYLKKHIDANLFDFKARGELIALEKDIKMLRRGLSFYVVKGVRQTIIDIEETLNEEFAKISDEDLVKLGIECELAQHINGYAGALDGFAKTAKNLHPDDKPQEILDEFSRVIIEARQKFKERRAAAEERLPHLRKVYEMDGNYQKALADLLEAIELRDQLVKEIKIAPPEKIREGQLLIQEMTKKIDESEEALAAEYEAFQTHARAVDALRDEAKSSTDEELRRLRLHFKENPDDMKELQKIIEEEFPEK